MSDTWQEKCTHRKCHPKTHPKCSQCQQELRNRHDCLSGREYLCRQCPGSVCEKCCKKVPKMEWETFYNRLIKIQKPKCAGCKSKVYQSEGFMVKTGGKLVWFCSHSCREENPADEDETWGCWAMHPPEEMLSL